ncbi:hypothetical protein PCE1_003579 [Barthelona sp. PCE]
MEHQFIQYVRIYTYKPHTQALRIIETINGFKEDKTMLPIGYAYSCTLHTDEKHTIEVDGNTMNLVDIIQTPFVDNNTGLVVAAEIAGQNVDHFLFETGKDHLHFVRMVNNVPLLVYEAHPNQKCVVFMDQLFRHPEQELTVYRINRGDKAVFNAQNITQLGFNTKRHEIRERKNVDDILKEVSVQVTVAIDFTASNGKPSNPTSLHHGNNNEYTKVIESLNVFNDYDADGMIDAFGFGAIIPPQRQVQHVFRLSQNGCHGVEGVLNRYREIKNTIRFSGPTLLCPLLTAYGSLVDPSEYNILVIVLDGQINDIDDCFKVINERLCMLPISIVLVGVGNADFGLLEQLDGDGELSFARRDIVQFVQFSRFANLDYSLTNELFEEIPMQVEEWYASRR